MDRKSQEIIKNEIGAGNIRGILRADTTAQDKIKEEILNDGNELESEPAAKGVIKIPTVELQKDSLSQK